MGPGEVTKAEAGAARGWLRGGTAGSMVIPCATAFIASACVMAVEMLAFRIIARFLGSSQYTTGSVIGVVLGGLAVGNYIGGRVADRFRTRPALAVLFVLSSAGCAAVPVLNAWVGQWSALWEWSWPARCAGHVTLTFLVPCGLLGTIGPVVAKMALDANVRVGRTIGGVYAWGVIGSIVGTFATSFYLIPHFGIQAIVFAFAGLLALMGVLFGARQWLPWTWGAALALLALWAFGPWPGARAAAADIGLREEEGPDVLFSRESEYSHVSVKTVPRGDGERVLLLDKLAHSFFNPERPDALLYGYERVYDGVTNLLFPGRDDLRALILGGGGYTHPRYFLRHRPKSMLEVVEIDPVVTEAAVGAFGLSPDERLKIVHLDARQHVVNLVEQKRRGEPVARFDLIFLDAVNDFNVPSHLTTVEFQALVAELLSPEGAFLTTLIDILDVGRMLAATVETTRRTFPEVSCFFAHEGEVAARLEGAERHTFVVVGSYRPLELSRLVDGAEGDGLTDQLVPESTVRELVERVRPEALTDDHAPVEYLLAPVVQLSEQKNVPARFYNRANRTADAGRRREAEADYRRAIELNRSYFDRGQNQSVHFFAHLNLGFLLFEQGRGREAARVFEEMTRVWADEPEPWRNLGSVRYSMGDYAGAVAAYEQCLERKASASAWHDLGLALGRMGRLAESKEAFGNALALRPDYAEAQARLAEVERAIAATQPATASQEEP